MLGLLEPGASLAQLPTGQAAVNPAPVVASTAAVAAPTPPLQVEQAVAQTPVVPAVPARAEKEDVWGVAGHPIIGYGPESSLVLGAGTALYYNIRPGDPDQRLDEYGLNVTYSLRNQGGVSLDGTHYLKGNDLFLKGTAKFINSPNSFYGIGANTPDIEEEFTQIGMNLGLALQTMVLPGLYIGPEYDFFYSDVTDVEAGSRMAVQDVLGVGSVHESGLGFMITYDTTNRKLYKLDGTRIELHSGVYHAGLASTHTFGTSSLAVRKYISLRGKVVLAMHASAQTSYGDVPFFYLSSLGSSRLLRGYSGERYLANHFLGAQAELRAPLFWRFGATAFAGAGEVAQELGDFGTTVRAAGGLGLRLALNKRQTINLRFDLTYNTDGETEKYLKLREAF